MKRALPWILILLLIAVAAWLAPRPPDSAPISAAETPHLHLPSTRAEDAANLPAPLVALEREHEVELVYFVPADREASVGQPERMRVAARFAADFLRRDLEAKGHPTEGLDFVFDGDVPRVDVVRGLRPAAWYRGEEARAQVHGQAAGEAQGEYWSVYHEVASALGPAEARVYVIYADVADAGQPCFDAHGNLALGALLSRDGGALVISAWAADEAWCAADAMEQLVLFDDQTPVEGCLRKDGSRVLLPRFEYVEEAVGSLTHEIGHALGMLHDFRTPEEDLMGRGARHFRPGYRGMEAAPPRLWLSPQNVLLLRRSPFLFDDVDLADTGEPVLEGHIGEGLRAGATEVGIELVAMDEGELAALVFVSPRLDTILAGVEAHGRRFEFRRSVQIPALEGGTLEIVAFAVDHGGNRAAIVMRRTVE